MSVLPPSMSDRDGKIWMDGQMVEWRDAKIHVLSHTLHYGCGAFEGVRAYNTVKARHLPPAGAHRAPVQQRQDFAHGHPLSPKSKSTKPSAPWCVRTSSNPATSAP